MRVERQLWFWVVALVVLTIAVALLREQGLSGEGQLVDAAAQAHAEELEGGR